MMVDQLLQTIAQAGGSVTVDGGNLVLEAPRPLTEALLAEVKRHKADLLGALTQPGNLDTLLTEACQGVEGIDAATFRALLSPEDIEDILAGHIPVVTLNAYARSWTCPEPRATISSPSLARPSMRLFRHLRSRQCIAGCSRRIGPLRKAARSHRRLPAKVQGHQICL